MRRLWHCIAVVVAEMVWAVGAATACAEAACIQPRWGQKAAVLPLEQGHQNASSTSLCPPLVPAAALFHPHAAGRPMLRRHYPQQLPRQDQVTASKAAVRHVTLCTQYTPYRAYIQKEKYSYILVHVKGEECGCQGGRYPSSGT